MIFYENRQLAWNITPFFCYKLGKLSQNLSSAAVVIGALRVKVNDMKGIKNPTQNFFLNAAKNLHEKMNFFA